MKKKIIYFFLCLFLCLLFGMGKAEKAQAAPVYQSIKINTKNSKQNRTVGGTTFLWGRPDREAKLYAITNGTKKVLLSAEMIDTEIITNGKIVYCKAGPFVYRISVADGVTGKYELEEGIYCELKGYYNGKIFYLNKNITLCSYNIKSGETRTVAKSIKDARQYGKYIYLTDWPRTFTFRVYNAKKGTFKTISKTAAYYDIVSGTVFYVDCLKSKPDAGRTPGMGAYLVSSLKKCKLDGSGKKTVLKRIKIQIYNTKKITKNSITYYDDRNKKVKKRF